MTKRSESAVGSSALVVVSTLFAALSPWDVIGSFWVATTSSLVIVPLLLTWFHVTAQRGRPLLPTGQLKLLAIVLALACLWALVTVLWSWDPIGSLVAAVGLVGLAASVFPVAWVAASGRFLYLTTALSVGSGALALATLMARPDPHFAMRTTVLGADQNYLAFSLSLGLAAQVYSILSAVLRSRVVLHAVLIAGTLAAIIVTGSRAGLVAGVVTLVVGTLLSLRERSLFRKVVPIVLAGGSLFALYQSGRVPPRIIDYLSAPVASDGRELIVEAFQKSQERWELFGVGIDASARYLELFDQWRVVPHNLYARLFVEGGVVALAIASALVGLLLIGAWRSGHAAFFLLVSAPIASAAYSLGGFQANALWLIIGLSASGLGRIKTGSNDAPVTPPLNSRVRGREPY